jgi:hypothetical protein
MRKILLAITVGACTSQLIGMETSRAVTVASKCCAIGLDCRYGSCEINLCPCLEAKKTVTPENGKTPIVATIWEPCCTIPLSNESSVTLCPCITLAKSHIVQVME